MATPCYNGPNPIDTQERRMAVWKWAKEFGGIDRGDPIEKVMQAVNDKFYSGQAKQAWLTDILSGRKTPFRAVANDMWRKAYNRQTITAQAEEIAKQAAMGPVAKWMRRIATFPRTLAVTGHGIVFPITHAGDLIFNPFHWGTFIKGTLRAYHGSFSSAFSKRMLDSIAGEPEYDYAVRSGVNVGPKSQAKGLITNTGTKTGFWKAAARSWDMLTVMRYELWKKQFNKYTDASMTEAQKLEVGKQLADWANHATGSGKGPIAGLGGNALFGPELTQSKLNRLTIDPVKTIKTFADWKNATAGQKAVAWTRLSGAAAFAVTNLGFLAVNQGLLYALGQKDKINVTDPTKGDFLAFKGGGILGNVPGLHTEIKTLAKILATSFASSKQLRGESKFAATAKVAGQYGMAKLTPTIQRGLEVGLGQDWMGRPLPWSKEETKKDGTTVKPKMSYGEYAASIGPIPLEGPVGFVYDKFRKSGMSALDATNITKALIIGGFGLPGFHVREDFGPPKPRTHSTVSFN